MKKITSLLLVFTLMLTISVQGVDAKTAPDSLTVERTYVLNDIITNHDHAFVQLQTTDGDYVYCLDVDKTPLESGKTASYSTTGDAGLLYILQNGYPNVDITGNQEFDFYVTQAAIWWYLDDTDQGAALSDEYRNATDTDIYKAIPNYIEPMVEAAKSAADTQATPSMEFTASDSTITLNGDYYETGYMSAALVSASEYTVTLSGAPDGTEVVAEDGTVKNTYSSSERFLVRVPTSSLDSTANITVTVSATGTTEKAVIYSPTDSSYQRVIGLYDLETALEDSTVITVTGGNTAEEVSVPNTSANIIFWSVVLGVLAIIVSTGVIIYQDKHKNNKNNNKKSNKKKLA